MGNERSRNRSGLGLETPSKVLLSVFKPKNETPSSSCELHLVSLRILMVDSIPMKSMAETS
jgi:hypothetical protein